MPSWICSARRGKQRETEERKGMCDWLEKRFRFWIPSCPKRAARPNVAKPMMLARSDILRHWYHEWVVQQSCLCCRQVYTNDTAPITTYTPINTLKLSLPFISSLRNVRHSRFVVAHSSQARHSEAKEGSRWSSFQERQCQRRYVSASSRLNWSEQYYDILLLALRSYHEVEPLSNMMMFLWSQHTSKSLMFLVGLDK